MINGNRIQIKRKQFERVIDELEEINQIGLESLKMEIAVRLDMVENCQICYTLNVISGSFISEKGQI